MYWTKPDPQEIPWMFCSFTFKMSICPFIFKIGEKVPQNHKTADLISKACTEYYNSECEFIK